MRFCGTSGVIKVILSVILAVSCISTFAQDKNKLLREGNKLYEKGKYGEAEVSYRKGIELDKEDVKGRYNLGDALYQQKKFDESARMFDGLSQSKEVDNKTKASIYHNLGNSLLESKEYEKSIDAFKKSLLNDPSDRDTKYNLEYAKLMLKKQQQQQQQQKQDQKKQDQKKDQDKKDQQDQQKQDQQQNQQQDPRKISKEDAERMLEALKNDEKKTMQKVKKEKVKSQQQVIFEKDW